MLTPSRFNPQLLRYFSAVVTHGSLSAAARHLHCVPSNVSARLRQLEEQLGSVLLERNGPQFTLTAAGERLLPHARQLDVLCSAAWQSVHLDTLQGRLRLGSMETTAAMRLPVVLARFHRHAPRVAMELETGSSAVLIERVLGHDLDAALVAGPLEHPRLIADEVWREELRLVLPADMRLPRRGDEVGLIVFPEGCHYRARLLNWAQESGLTVTGLQSYASVEAIIGCVAAGLGAGVLPASLLAAHPRGDQVLSHPLPVHLASSPTMLIRRRQAEAHPALDAWVEVLLGEHGVVEDPGSHKHAA